MNIVEREGISFSHPSRFILVGTAKLNLLFSTLFGYAPMLSPGKVRELLQSEWLCDNSDFSEATGWRPELDLRQGALQLFRTEK